MELPKGSVPVPELGEQAYFHMTINVVCEIEEHMLAPEDFESDGPGWQRFYGWLDRLDLTKMKRIAALCINGAGVDVLFEKVALDVIAGRLADALTLTLYGRTTAEQVAHREREYLEHLQKLAEQKKAAEDVE